MVIGGQSSNTLGKGLGKLNTIQEFTFAWEIIQLLI